MKQIKNLFILLFIICTPVKSGFSLEVPQSSRPASAETLRPLLNSERIRQKFGSYGLDILQGGEKIRVSNLYSVQNGKKTTRTLALVVYPEVIDLLLSTEHQKIINGQSIGEVFKGNGWRIKKQHVFFGEIEASSNFAGVYSLMGGVAPVALPIHIYNFFVRKNGAEFLYASISEIHHPDYLDANDLQGIYEEEFGRLQNRNEEIQTILEIVIEEMRNI